MNMMKGIVAAAFVVLSVSAASAEEKGAAPAKPSNAQLTPAADMKWMDVPNMAGIKMAVAQGDPMKGASHFFVKFAPGTTAPLHHHTADHYVTVISGTLTLGVDGKETKLGAGSFFAFLKKAKHTTACDAGAECLLSIDSRGKWDVVPAEAPKAEKPAK